jgi:signal transduction histidine kinase
VALREYADEYEERHGITVSLHGEDAASSLTALAAYQVLRITQEALANVRKHSGARHAWIEFDARTPGQMHLVIGDDGLGFDPTVSNGQLQKTFGLASMRERAESLGGQLTIESQAGRGTRIIVDVPLQEAAHASSRATFAPATG